MKHLELNLKKRVLLVELPEIVIRTEIFNKESLQTAILCFTDDIHSFPVVIPNGDYKELGKLSDLKEEDFAELVQSRSSGGYEWYGNDGFCKNIPFIKTAKASFESAIESVGYYLKNPKGAIEPNMADDILKGLKYKDGNHSLWSEFEAKTFNPEQTYIFEICKQ